MKTLQYVRENVDPEVAKTVQHVHAHCACEKHNTLNKNNNNNQFNISFGAHLEQFNFLRTDM